MTKSTLTVKMDAIFKKLTLNVRKARNWSDYIPVFYTWNISKNVLWTYDLTVPVTSVQFAYLADNTSYNRVDNQSSLRLTKSYVRIKSGVTCEVMIRGSAVLPTVILILDNQNITRRFQISTSRVLDHNDGMLDRRASIILTYETFYPIIKDNLHKIYCSARVEHYPAKTAIAVMNVTCKYILIVYLKNMTFFQFRRYPEEI